MKRKCLPSCVVCTALPGTITDEIPVEVLELTVIVPLPTAALGPQEQAEAEAGFDEEHLLPLASMSLLTSGETNEHLTPRPSCLLTSCLWLPQVTTEVQPASQESRQTPKAGSVMGRSGMSGGASFVSSGSL